MILAPLNMRAISCFLSSAAELANLGLCAARALPLFDQEVLIGEGRDLRQMSHAKHLLAMR